MLRIGADNVSALYLGDTEIQRAWLGTALIFEKAPQGPLEFPYTGAVVPVALKKGRYKLEAWGAQGGYRSNASYAGKGGYSVGILDLTETTTVFVRVGGAGNTGGANGGFNGGGKRSNYPGGGGASDIRIGTDDVNHRVIVAGGGGSDGGSSKAGKYGGGLAGGDVGASGSANGYGTGGYGGTQAGNSGGASWITEAQSPTTTADADAKSGFGFGGNGVNKSGGFGGAGGGGWYGGSGRVPDNSGDDDGGGGGGSGFAWTGENAPAGFGLTEAHYLKNAETLDGSNSFPSPDGTDETGHSGNGYVRITPLLPPKMYTITVNCGENGTATGGGVYAEGVLVTVIAEPEDGYVLSGWVENGSTISTDNPYTFTLTGNRTLTAEFAVRKPSRLPEGYSELTYISNPNLTCVSLSEYAIPYAKTDNRVEIGMKLLDDSATGNICGGFYFEYLSASSGRDTRDSSFNRIRYDAESKNIVVDGGYNGTGTSPAWSATVPAPSDRFTMVIDYPKSLLTISSGDSTQSETIESPGTYRMLGYSLFAAYQYSMTRYSTDQSKTTINDKNRSPTNFQLYSYKVFSSDASSTGELQHELVPCINPDREVGLYDLKSNKFLGSYATDKSFAAGPEI